LKKDYYNIYDITSCLE